MNSIKPLPYLYKTSRPKILNLHIITRSNRKNLIPGGSDTIYKNYRDDRVGGLYTQKC